MRALYIVTLAVVLIFPALFAYCAPAPIYVNDFQVTPDPVIRGDNATLRWDVSGASKITIDNGIGAVPANGTLSVGPLQPTTYTLTAKNGGTSVQRTLTLTVSPRVITMVAPVKVPTIPALDTGTLLKNIGMDVVVEGDITYISSWLPSRYLEQGPMFPWTFIFFVSNPWEGASATLDLGYPCLECWRDYTAYFRAIIRPENIAGFVDPSTGAPTLYVGRHVFIHGMLTGYLSAPAIYLTDPGQVTSQ